MGFKELLTEAKSGPVTIQGKDAQKFMAPLAYAGSGVSAYAKDSKQFMDLFFKYSKQIHSGKDFELSAKEFELAFGVLAYVANVDSSWAKGAGRKEWKDLFDKYQQIAFGKMDEAKSKKAPKRPKIPMTMTVGTKFKTIADGELMDIKITKIELEGMHLKKPAVIITYDYASEYVEGSEDNTLEFFVKEIIGDRLK